MPSFVNAFPTVFENELFAGQVSANVRAGNFALRVSAEDGEFERSCLNVTLTVWCKATAHYYGEDRNLPEILIVANHLPTKMSAMVCFLEKLDLTAFMPETAEFRTMDSALDLAAFSARAAGMPADQVDEVRAEITATEDRESKTRIPGLPYKQPMRPDLFFNEIRDQLIEDAKKQLKGLVG